MSRGVLTELIGETNQRRSIIEVIVLTRRARLVARKRELNITGATKCTKPLNLEFAGSAA